MILDEKYKDEIRKYLSNSFIEEAVELKEFNRLKPDDVRDAYGEIELKYRSSSDIRDAERVLKKAGINVRKDGDTLEVDSDSPAFKKARITSSFDSSKREKLILKVLGESVKLDENRAIVYNPRMIRAFIKQVEKKFPKYKGEIQQADEPDEIVFPNDPKLIKFFKGAREVKFVLKDSTEIEEANVQEAVKPEDFIKGGNIKITKADVNKLIGKIFISSKLSSDIEKAKAYVNGFKGKNKKNPYKKDTADFHLFILGQQVGKAS